MVVSIVKWLKRVKLLKISRWAIIICLILSVIFAGFTIYGNAVGNYIIGTESSEAELSLSQNEDLSNQTSRIAVKGVKKMNLSSYLDGSIPDDVPLGSHNGADDDYMAFSFYLINNSKMSISYNWQIRILEATQNIQNCVRVKVRVENSINSVNEYVYGKIEADGSNITSNNQSSYEFIPFVSDKIVCDNTVSIFKKSEYVRFTIFVWIEGWDEPDCNDSIKGALLKMEMMFNGYTG